MTAQLGSMEQVLKALNEGYPPPALMATPSIKAAFSFVKQSKVAREMCLDGSIISLWLKGRRPIPGNRIEKLFGVLHKYTDFDPTPDCSSPAVLRLEPSPGYAHTSALMAEPMHVVAVIVPEPEPEPEPRATRSVEPEFVPVEGQLEPAQLRWCTSTHGVRGILPRRHHHGPVVGCYPGVVTSTAAL